MKNEILSVCNQLVAAAFNGVYQGIIITILVALCLRWLVRTNAATRHAVWFCTLLLLAGLVVAHGLVDAFSLRPATTKDTLPSPNAERAIPETDAALLSEIEAASGSSAGHAENTGGDWSTGLEKQLRAGQHPLLAALIEAQQGSVGDVAELEQPNGVETGNPENVGVALASDISNEPSRLRRLVERLLNPISVEFALESKLPKVAGVLLLALWLVMASFRVFTLLLQLAQIQKLKHQSLPPSEKLNELFQKLSAGLVTHRNVALRVSPAHRSSFLLGFVRPVVLLPAEESMELGEAEMVLRHELAHLERRDDWMNLIQHFLLAIFPFHPAFWWICRQLSLEREIACDDHVLQQSKRPQAYALVLANLAARMQRTLPLLAPGSSNRKTQLKERIDMILNTHRNASPRLAKAWLALITSTAALVTVAVICAAPRIVLAQSAAPSGVAAVAPAAGLPPVAPVLDVVPPAPAAGLPHPVSADHERSTPPPPAGLGTGAKFKGSSRVSVNASPAVIAAPAVSVAPGKVRVSATTAAPGHPATIVAGVEPPSEPKPPRAPRPTPAPAPRAENRDGSLEERLDRLERMVNSLMHQLHPKGGADFQLKLEKDGTIDRKEIAKIEALAQQHADYALKVHPHGIEKIKEQAERDAKRAAEHAKRATAEVEKAHKAEQKQSKRSLKADSQKQLDALRKQIEALERQKDELDRQIDRLERDQDKLEDQDEDSDDNDSQLNESKE